VFSLVFYAWGEPVNVLILIGSVLINTMAGFLVSRGSAQKRKIMLVIDISINIGILFIFKYLGFVLGILKPVIGNTGVDIALPIGISFFTFQAISYVVDVYKGLVKPEDPFKVGLYISFFPQLIAGPIIQYKSVSDQIVNRKLTFDMFSSGMCRFAVGVIKKVLLANTFASLADNIFNWSMIGTDYYPVPVSLAWLGSISYTLQIYYDFSAYSDMAIGLALCFGFKFAENFNYPYIADSISDFWKRWHISLTNWFREYVYFPLGGSRVENRDLMVRNLFIVWLLTGIWHGANWTFILWGLFYFVIQLAERFFRYPEKIHPKWLRHVYTLLIVNFAWVLFRAENLYQAGIFLKNMFGINRNGFFSDMAVLLLRENWVFFLAGILFAMPVVRTVNEYLYENPKSIQTRIMSVGYIPVICFLFILSVSYLMSGSYNPFIYFNF
jgi:alginate O-acetyltransferase complex protein AlgI